MVFLYSRFGGKDPAYYEFTIGKCYVYMFSTLTMCGWDTLPSKFPAKIALISLLFFGTMIYWHWEAMLLSYLATRVTSLPFIDIPDLVSNTEFRIILTPGSSSEDSFKTSTDPNWQVAWTDRVQPHLEEHTGFSFQDFADEISKDGLSAWFSNYFSVM